MHFRDLAVASTLLLSCSSSNEPTSPVTGRGATGGQGGGHSDGGAALAGKGGSGATAAGGMGGNGTSASGGVAAKDSGISDVSFDYQVEDAMPEDACASTTVAADIPPVDIIWIVDQSTSMNEETTQIAVNINTNFRDIIQ